MKNIVVVGDSFTYGHGCSDREVTEGLKFIDPETGESCGYKQPSRYCWASLLQKDLPEFKITNCATPGNSSLGILQTVMVPHAITKEEKVDLIIYAGTFQDRIPIPNHNENNTITQWVMGQDYPDEDEEIKKAKKYYIKYLSNSYTLKLTSLSAFMAAYGWARMNDSKFLFSIPYEFHYNFENYIDPISHLQFTHLYDYIYHDNPLMLKTCISKIDKLHPNNMGHSVYYENVIKPKVLNYIKENL